ncbi:MAG: GNAT family N-acetyltransferase [Anaerolineae bacterium]|nr:GNAT family N-acetyltransferase [Anaerolineae bacterium]
MKTTVYRDATADDATAIARIQVDTWWTTYRGIMPDAVLERLSYERSEANWRTGLENPQSRSFVKLACDENDTVLGFAAAGPEREGSHGFDGEIYAIYVLQSAQRGGLGVGLVTAAAIKLLARGIDNMIIWVLRDNPLGRGFYERIGGEQVTEREISIGGVMMPEIGYGWRDLAGSLKRDFGRLD